MKNSSDITEKIRSAIKAKLGQIGAYVDDELPDYIMVMIANKKSMKQITDDLKLFLGTKTERFTDWLDKLLTKLQAVDGDDDTKTTEKKALEKDMKLKEDLEKKTEESKGKKEEKKHSRKRRSDERRKSVSKDDKRKRSKSPKSSNSQLEDAIEIQAQDESEFDEVVKAKVAKSEKEDNKLNEGRKLISTSTGENVPVRKVRQDLIQAARKRQQTLMRKRSQSLSGRSSGGMTSVIGSVKLKQSSEEEDDDEEEEFVRGGVSSVVRPQRRERPADPRRQEKLLMRACREATHSVEHRRRPSRDENLERRSRDPRHLYRPAARETRHSDRRESGFRSDYEYSSNPKPVKSKYDLVSSGTQTSPLVVQQSVIPTGPPDPVVTGISITKRVEQCEASLKSKVTGSERSVYDYSPTKISTARRRLSPKRLSPEFKSMPVDRTLTPEPVTVRKNPSADLQGFSDSDGSIVEVTDDIRRVQCDEVYGKIRYADYPMDDDNVVNVIDKDSCSKQWSEPLSSEDEDSDPKFIVTLDGVPPVLSKTIVVAAMDDDDDCRNDLGPLTSTPIVRKEVSLEEIIQERADTDDKIGKSLDELIAEKQNNVRCKFWPQCKNGADCPYVHPSTACHMFPKCSFGSRCLYIHPNCRYDANCVNADCPYLHSSPRDPVTLAAAKVMKTLPQTSLAAFMAPPPALSLQQQPHHQPFCRFYPQCYNPNCPFLHRKTCRHGTACRYKTSGCPFAHPGPVIPEAADRFKWCSTDKFVISSDSTS